MRLHSLRVLLLVAVIGGTCSSSPAQPAASKHVVTMQECSGLPCVDVSAAGRTLRLLIDTGNPNSVLDQAIAQQLGLPLEPIVRNGKATGFSRTKLSHARISDLELDLPMTVMDVSGYVSSNQMPKADGTLGYKAFEGRALRLDYPHKSIEVSGPQSDCTGPCGKLSLITFGQHGPPILVVSGFDVNGKPLSAQVDTLFAGTLLVYPTSVEKLGLSALAKTQQKRSFPYTDGGVDMFEAPGTTQGFAGTLLKRGAPVYFATPDVHQPDGMFDGTVGDALLGKFAVTLDLSNMTIAIDGSH